MAPAGTRLLARLPTEPTLLKRPCTSSAKSCTGTMHALSATQGPCMHELAPTSGQHVDLEASPSEFSQLHGKHPVLHALQHCTACTSTVTAHCSSITQAQVALQGCQRACRPNHDHPSLACL